MRKIPDGWGDQYTLRYLYDRVASLNGSAPTEDTDLRYAFTQMQAKVYQLEQDASQRAERIAELEAELARLDAIKANRAGRKPKDSTA